MKKLHPNKGSSLRVCYGLLLFCAFLAWLFTNQAGTRLILLGVLLLPLLSWAGLTLFPRNAIQASWQAPETLTRGDTLRMELTLKNTLRRPVALEGTLRAEQPLWNGREDALLSLRLPRRGETCLFPALEQTHCGLLRISVSDCHATEAFGLFTRTLHLVAGLECLVLPRPRPMELRLAETGDFLQDSTRYSTAQPGYDPSETFRVREYVPGDPIRQIHWKLSEKTDALLVRDLGLPIVSRLLFLLDLRPDPAEPDALDLLLDCMFSAALSLCQQGEHFDLGWVSPEGQLLREQIDGEEALDAALTALLRQDPAPEDISPPAALLEREAQCAYAHIAVFSPRLLPEAEALERGNLVSVLVPMAVAAADPTLFPRVRVLGINDDLSELEL